jgi:hypothetical protein
MPVNIISRLSAVLLLSVAICTCPEARADWTLDLVRISCVKEIGYLTVEVASANGNLAIHGAIGNTPEWSAALEAWRRHGFHDPHNLRMTCAFLNTAYTVIVTQSPARERGMCGAAPPMLLTILRDDVEYVRNVVLGYNCLGGPSIERLDIWGDEEMILSGPSKGSTSGLALQSLKEIRAAIPITGESLKAHAR